MEDSRMPSGKTVMKSLRPTKALIVIPIRTKLGPLPIGIAAENDGTRILAAIDASLGKALREQILTGKM
jgi:hypothetical protein